MRQSIRKPILLLGLMMLIVLVSVLPHPISSENREWPDLSSSVEFDGSILLGRPTQTTMSVRLVPNHDVIIKLLYGSKTFTSQTSSIHIKGHESAVLIMNDLAADSSVTYRLAFKTDDSTTFQVTPEYTFHTPRSSGSPFNFVIQSDSHLANKANPELYRENMIAMNQLSPDFFFDLGDTFLNDQAKDLTKVTQAIVDETYLQQLPYLSLVAREAPLFLTIGNHEGEYGTFLAESSNNLASYSTFARTKYALNPGPNSFYSGNAEVTALGTIGNYYAFTWGDALFVSIDPYRYSMVSPSSKDSEVSKDGWAWTLGKTQYDWFRSTLENSTAKYKFVFSHHALGNYRGGSAIASLYEWGGLDLKGNDQFDQERPDWGKPIQTIMEDTGVTLFFQGHDHLFSREDVNGVVYVTLPKPAETVADKQYNFSSYKNGDTLLNSGFLNVSVDDDRVQVDYIRTYFMGAGSQSEQTGIVYRFTVNEDHEVSVLKNVKDDLSTYGQNEAWTSEPQPEEGLLEVLDGDFAFAIQADSHLDEKTDTALYTNTLMRMKQIDPSFVIDLGDTFMSEKYAKTSDMIQSRYVLSRSYFNLLSDIPLYLVNGNHDGETGTDPLLRNQALAMRLRYFPQTGSLLSGNTTTANYYAFKRNNALFVVLDPYTYTMGKMSLDGWNGTLGKVQYDWLKATLADSDAQFKFIFIHTLIAGNGDNERGGIEAARYFEWGGNSLDGSDDFDEKRPGWGIPIHELLVQYGVTAVFHGHDHFFAQQTLDGILYQLVPQPGTNGNSVDHAEEYGYQSGFFLPSAGFLRVVVRTDSASIEYIKIDNEGFSLPQVTTLFPSR
jgi:predicted phosphodiesterase